MYQMWTTCSIPTFFKQYQSYVLHFRDTTLPPRQFKSLGLIKNFNTIEDFKECDKKQLLQHNAVKVSLSSITILIMPDVITLDKQPDIVLHYLKSYIWSLL